MAQWVDGGESWEPPSRPLPIGPVPEDEQCVEPTCKKRAALTRDGVQRCVVCHRARNGGRIC